ncbi:MAG: carboxypeptidase [Rhizobiaceae bacterium]|nr:carboxypeptidase [Rhizobiaceae bacterium]|tara:strand:+ start:220 stop:1332 length:1113 start_codon:yes stop_codon:yes gene_type:complete
MSTSADIDILKTWIEAESPSHDAAAVGRMADIVTAHISDTQIAVERVPGKDGLGDWLILRAGPQTNEPPLLLLSHLDTVHPLGTVRNALPFRAEDDLLYGPGIYDMKGGMYIGIEAFKDVVQRGAANRPIVYLCTPDEEIGSPTSREQITAFGKSASAVLVTEPARDGGKVVTARKGLGLFNIKVSGRAAHAGMRHADGRSAIAEAARLVLAIEAMTDRLRGITANVGMISGGTAVNTVPEFCSFPVDVRFENPEGGKRICDAIAALKPSSADYKVEIIGGEDRPAYDHSEQGLELFEKARLLASEIGFELAATERTGGVSDGNFTAILGTPTLDGMGVDGAGAHTLHEHIYVSSIAPRKALLTRLMETL